MTRKTIATGIYRDPYGYEVRWRDAGVRCAKRFPLDTPLEILKGWRKTQRALARSTTPYAGSFVRDAVRWLARRKILRSFKSDRAHLRPWIHRFRSLSRFAITREKIRDTLSLWQAQGYSPRELRHRWRILSQLLATLDPDRVNPCTGIKLPPIVKARPRTVSDDVLTAVALQLRRQEMDGIGRLRSAKTRARFLVLATTGMRPSQLMRALPMDLDLDRRLWIVQPAKGDKGSVIYLNEEMLNAARLFIAAEAWGHYDTRSFAHTLRRNGWPKGIRPYTVRHGVGQALRRSGADLGDIQDHLGHRSPATTAAFYLEPELARLKQTSERLSGRVGIAAFAAPDPATFLDREKAKERQKPPDSISRQKVAGLATAAATSKKRA